MTRGRTERDQARHAQVIVANDTPYVIDCGDGVARQLVIAGVSLDKLRHIFVTHHHSDHNADYGNLIWLAWAAGLRAHVDTWGPPPLEKMTRLFFEMNAYDIDTRIADEGRVPLAPLVRAHELSQGGLVMKDDNVRVTAALVDHPPVVPAFAYRFDAADRSIVISGDTTRCDNVVQLAQGADVLVHSALYVPAVDRWCPSRQRGAAQAEHHRPPDVGRTPDAWRGRGRKDVGSRTSGAADDPEVTEQMWIDAARAHFRVK